MNGEHQPILNLKAAVAMLTLVAIVGIVAVHFAQGDGPRPLSIEDEKTWKALLYDYWLAQVEAAPYQERVTVIGAEISATFQAFQEKYDAPEGCRLLKTAAWECEEPEPAPEPATDTTGSKTGTDATRPTVK